MIEFKVGDSVRLTHIYSSDSKHGIKVGDCLIVVRITEASREHSTLWVKSPMDGQDYPLYPSQVVIDWLPKSSLMRVLRE